MSKIYITDLDTTPENDGAWNLEGSQLPCVYMFAQALQVWCVAQNRTPISVNEAALAFNTTKEVIEKARDHHGYMYVANGFIEHDGE